VAKLRELSQAGVGNVFLRTVDTLSFPAAEVELYGSRMRQAVAGLP
jgi:hypothetical protein